jgi:hypothetical protein
MSEINDLLNGTESEAVEVETVEAVEPVETVETEVPAVTEEVIPAATEEVEEVPTGLEKVELPSTEELQSQVETITKELNAYKTKAKDEKTKRQELEKKELPDVYDDNFADSLLNEAQQLAVNERFNLSEFMARKEFPDLDQKITAYEALVESNPALQQQLISAASPYHEMVDIVDKHERVSAMENIDEWEAKKTAEIEQKVRQKIEAEQAVRDGKVAGLSPSLAKVGSSPIAENTWTGPTPINDLIAS